jgi:DNA polymerase I-like protein with 3'-5' exonuclease and polymerase domains
MSNPVCIVLWSDCLDNKSETLHKLLEETGLLNKCSVVYTALGVKGKPLDKDIESNRERVLKEIEELAPKVILSLGNISHKSILPDKKESIKNLRERLHHYKTIPIIASYHPSSLERKDFNSSQMYIRLKEDLKWAYSLAFGEVTVTSNTPVNYRILDTKEALVGCLEKFTKTKKLTAVDFETNTRSGKSLWAYDSLPMTLSISQEEGVSYGIGIAHPQSPFLSCLPWLYQTVTAYFKDMTFLAHSASFENACFSRWFPGVKATEDTLLMAKILDEFSKHDLHTLTNQYTTISSHKEYYLAHPNIENDEMPIEHLLEANLADADATLRLYNKFLLEFDDYDTIFYKEYLMGQFVPVVDHMIQNGIQIDTEFVRSIIPYYIQMEHEYTKAGKEMFGININSAKQKSELLLNLGFILPHTKEGHSTDKDALKHARLYCPKNKLPILNFFQKYNEINYLNTYYLSKIFDWIGEDGRVHPWYNTFGTKTGRISSQRPNAQNLSRTGNVKKMFKTDGWFLALDFSAFEFRIFSMLAEDFELMARFKEGLDVHKYHAAVLYNKDISQVTKEERQNTKGAVSFGVLFGAGNETVAKTLGISTAEAKKIVDWVKLTYPSINQYYNAVTNENTEKGYYQSTLGRKWRGLGTSFNQQINKPIQGTASFLCLMAGYQLMRSGFTVVQNVHDSLVLEFKELPTAEEIYEVYTTACGVQIPGYEHIKGLWDAELSIGKNLGELVKL